MNGSMIDIYNIKFKGFEFFNLQMRSLGHMNINDDPDIA
jgi:hypothetical protein